MINHKCGRHEVAVGVLSWPMTSFVCLSPKIQLSLIKLNWQARLPLSPRMKASDGRVTHIGDPDPRSHDSSAMNFIHHTTAMTTILLLHRLRVLVSCVTIKEKISPAYAKNQRQRSAGKKESQKESRDIESQRVLRKRRVYQSMAREECSRREAAHKKWVSSSITALDLLTETVEEEFSLGKLTLIKSLEDWTSADELTLQMHAKPAQARNVTQFQNQFLSIRSDFLFFRFTANSVCEATSYFILFMKTSGTAEQADGKY